MAILLDFRGGNLNRNELNHSLQKYQTVPKKTNVISLPTYTIKKPKLILNAFLRAPMRSNRRQTQKKGHSVIIY